MIYTRNKYKKNLKQLYKIYPLIKYNKPLPACRFYFKYEIYNSPN